jgi:hypothetical protein
VDVGEELLERAVQHRAAPHHGLVAALEEEADRHELQAVLDGRHDQIVHGDRPLPDAEHVRDRVPVDVRVEDAHPVAGLRERDREVRRERRLAHAALAARDREHAAVGGEPDHAVALGRAAAQLLCQRLPLLGSHHVERQLSAGHTGHLREHPLDLLLERVAKRAAGNGEDDCERDDAVVDLEVPHHVELGDRAAQLGVDHPAERLQDGVAIRLHRSRVAPRRRAGGRLRAAKRSP